MEHRQAQADASRGKESRLRSGGFWAVVVLAGVLGGAVPTGFAGLTSHSQDGQTNPQSKDAPPAAVSARDFERQEQKTPVPDAQPAGAERRRLLAEESAKLLQMATELKAEVDKTNKDTLSMQVIRKATEIEKLARTVRGK